MTTFPHRLERSLVIRAWRETVFAHFVENERFARWMGAGSELEPRIGGRVSICFPGGVRVLGQVLELAAPERLVFDYGFESGQPIPPGGSRVSLQLETHPLGTRLTLLHEFTEAGIRDHFVQGWRHQLALFANLVGDGRRAQAERAVDDWFGAWSEDEPTRREALVRGCAAPGIEFRDKVSLLVGYDDLLPHLAAARHFMPGTALARQGDLRLCQETALADWVMTRSDGQPQARGTNVFWLDADGRIVSAVGFWA